MSTVSSTTSTTSTASTTATAISQLIASSNTSSGLNDNSIISELVSIESQPLTNLQKQTTALQTQISAIGAISSALQSLSSAADALQQNGVVGLTAGANTAFTASASVGAQAGTYTINVGNLAVAAKSRSQGYTSTQTFSGGTLNMTVQGKPYSVTIADGSSLLTVATAIKSAGVPASAAVISDGTSSYLSITATSTGFPPTGIPSDALALSFTPAVGATGVAPTFGSIATAKNASLTVDGLPITSQTNAITTVIPGITLNLTAQDTADETLNIQADTTTTANNLQSFINAYNGVMKLVQAQLAVTAGSDATTSLAGDSTMTNLQQRLQKLFTSTISEATDITSLPAMGLTTSYTDGTLSLDTTVLSGALAKDPNAVNAMFGLSSDSIAQLAMQITTDYTSLSTGALSARTTGMNDQITQIASQENDLQAQIKIYQANLVQQFANMESIVSTLKSNNNYLTAQSTAASNSANG